MADKFDAKCPNCGGEMAAGNKFCCLYCHDLYHIRQQKEKKKLANIFMLVL